MRKTYQKPEIEQIGIIPTAIMAGSLQGFTVNSDEKISAGLNEETVTSGFAKKNVSGLWEDEE